MKRKFLTVLLALAAALCLCFGLAACGDEDTPKNDQGGEEFKFVLGDDATYWLESYGGNDADVVVPGEYEGVPVTRIKTHAFFGQQSPGCNDVKSVTLPDSVTTVESNAFRECEKLETVNLGKGVQIMQGEGDGNEFNPDAFAIGNCEALKKINVAEENAVYQSKDGVLYRKADKSIVFAPLSIEGTVEILEGCPAINRNLQGRQGLEEVTIPASVTSITTSSFSYCTNLNTVNWNAANCVLSDECYYNPVFAQCPSLTTINLGESVQTIPVAAFAGCEVLTSITIPENVTSIGAEAFNNCKSLKVVNWNAIACEILPRTAGGFNSSVAFDNCTSLETVHIGAKVKTLSSYAFYGCDRVLSITVPDSVEQIGREAFGYCERLREVTIGKGVTAMESGIFDHCYHLVHIRNLSGVAISGSHWGNYISGEKAEVLTSEDGEFQNKLERDENGVWTYTYHEEYDSDTVYAFDYDGESTDLDMSSNSKIDAVYPYAFYMRDDITSAKMGAGVTTLGELAFYRCNNLTTVTMLGDARDTETVRKAFAECPIQTATATAVSIAAIPAKYLKEATITRGALNTELSSYAALRELTIGAGVTEIGERAFTGCYHLVHIRNLSEVDITELVREEAEVLTNATDKFQNAIELDENGIWTYTAGDKVYAYDCEGEYTNALDLSKNGKINAIYPYAFYGRENLNSVVIPNTVTEIGTNAFSKTGLRSVAIPDSVEYIGSAAFYSCAYLTTVTIGANVRRIETLAFSGNNSLESVTFAEPDGWYRTYSLADEEGKSVPAGVFADPSAAAKYFKGTLENCPEDDKLGIYSLYRV